MSGHEGRVVVEVGPAGAASYWAVCNCGWEQPGARRRHHSDAEVDLAAHQSGTNPAAVIPAASHAVVAYDVTEWDIIRSQAATLARTQFVPQAYRAKPDDIIAAALYGREIGLGVTTALSYIHIVNGRPSLSAEGMVALVRARGHSITGTATATAAAVAGKRADTGDTMEVAWTADMAKRAKLTTETWQKYPEAMLWARAVSQLCRMLFPDVLLGLSYTPEEAADMIPAVTPQLDGRVEPAAVTGGSPMGDSVGRPSPPTGYVDEQGEIHVARQCGECHAPAGRQHATACSQRDPVP